MTGAKKPGPWLLASLLLGSITLAIFWPLTGYDLISLDDPEYIRWNPEIRQGLTFAAVKWSFCTGYTGNWHPLTWLSYMLDYQVFGGSPGQMHLTSLVLHTANVLLLFWLFWQLTGALWRSAFVAALFALHPLHVESVAWVCERKDVLSTFFGLLSILAYAGYAQSKVQGPQLKVRGSSFPFSILHPPFSFYYALSLLLFACSLMSKAMLVTLPLVLLLLDYWPMQRFSLKTRDAKRKALLPLLLEKVPFLALSLALSVITFFTQKAGGAMVSTTLLPVQTRVANALMAYWHYLRDAFWPAHLALCYPVRLRWPVWQPLLAAGLLLGLTAVVLWKRKQGYWVTGWFWFVITLVPVIGLLQVGSQTVADRFMYFPLAGLALCVTWATGDLLRKAPAGKAFLMALAAASLGLCAVASRRQISYWKDSLTLFEHTLAVTSDNIEAENLYGLALEAQGRRDQAIDHYKEALRINPASPQAHVNLGCALGSQGNLAQAIAHNRKALEIRPDYPEAHDNLGVALQLQGGALEAEAHFREAVRLRPSFSAARNHWAYALLQLGRLDEAITQMREAARYTPEAADIHLQLSFALRQKGELEQAVVECRYALRLKPEDPATHNNLAELLLREGKLEESLEHSLEALRLKPAFPEAAFNAADALSRQGSILAQAKQVPQAIARWRDALQFRPEWPELLNNLAWVLATHPDPKIRNGPEAVQLAERATAADTRSSSYLDTLAAAYAEAGRFADALKAIQKALSLAEAAGQTNATEKFRARRELYREQRPCREP